MIDSSDTEIAAINNTYNQIAESDITEEEANIVNEVPNAIVINISMVSLLKNENCTELTINHLKKAHCG